MGILDKLKGKALDFVWAIAMKKGLKRLVQSLIAYVATLPLGEYGVAIKLDEALLYSALIGLSEVARNWLKRKGGIESL